MKHDGENADDSDEEVIFVVCHPQPQMVQVGGASYIYTNRFGQ